MDAYVEKCTMMMPIGIRNRELDREARALCYNGFYELMLRQDSIQILVILSQFQTFGTKTKLQGFVWGHRSITVLISNLQIAMKC